MSDRTERGPGSMGDDDTELSRTPSSSSTGSTDRDSSYSATDSDLGMSTTDSGLGMSSSETGSETMRGITPERGTMDSTMGTADLGSGGTIGSSMETADLTPSSIDAGATPVAQTDADARPHREKTGTATGDEGGLSAALPGAAIGALAGAALGAAAGALLGGGDKDSTSHIEDSIEVDAPVRTVYNQWTQFEEFPRFMEGVERVQQLDDKRMHWQADIGFKDKEWDAEIVDQVPDQRVAWRSTSGAPNGGVVSFAPIDADRTRVTLRLEYAPEGFVETVGDTLGLVSRRVKGDLERFKQFIEARGTETGGWRGQV